MSTSGESNGNLKHVVDGQRLDMPLSADGVRQAEQAGQRLAEVAFTRAYASDLSRATETARAIVRANKTGFNDVAKIEVRKAS